MGFGTSFSDSEEQLEGICGCRTTPAPPLASAEDPAAAHRVFRGLRAWAAEGQAKLGWAVAAGGATGRA